MIAAGGARVLRERKKLLLMREKAIQRVDELLDSIQPGDIWTEYHWRSACQILIELEDEKLYGENLGEQVRRQIRRLCGKTE